MKIVRTKLWTQCNDVMLSARGSPAHGPKLAGGAALRAAHAMLANDGSQADTAKAAGGAASRAAIAANRRAREAALASTDPILAAGAWPAEVDMAATSEQAIVLERSCKVAESMQSEMPSARGSPVEGAGGAAVRAAKTVLSDEGSPVDTAKAADGAESRAPIAAARRQAAARRTP